MSIEIPEGKEIDLDNSTIVFKDKCPWPTSINDVGPKQRRPDEIYSTVFNSPNKEYIRAARAFADLVWLRDAYRNGWKPDYEEGVWTIYLSHHETFFFGIHYTPSFLSFETEEQAEHFFKHHEELIKQAIPLMS